MAKTKRAAQVESGPILVRSGVAGQARLSVRVVDRRYTAQKVVEGLNAGELKYAAGQITRGGHVVARYQILDLDDHLEDFQVVA
jgi:hypothetical protein